MGVKLDPDSRYVVIDYKTRRTSSMSHLTCRALSLFESRDGFMA